MTVWFRKPINIAITVGAAVLALVVIILIAWGVTQHTEGGLLQVCWENGAARYVEGVEGEHGSCERPEELVWPQEQIPITVAAESADGEALVADAPEVRVLAQAIADINAQVGFTLLRVAPGDRSSAATVHFGQALGENSPPGHITHRRVGGELEAHIFIRSDVGAGDRLLFLVVRHELLHLPGLAHDDFRSSLMYPLTRDDTADSVPSTAHVTDYDIRLLQRYR